MRGRPRAGRSQLQALAADRAVENRFGVQYFLPSDEIERLINFWLNKDIDMAQSSPNPRPDLA